KGHSALRLSGRRTIMAKKELAQSASRTKKIQSVNPYTGEVMGEFTLMTQREINRAIAASREAFAAWRAKEVAVRSICVKKLAQHLRAEKRMYAEVMTKEMGKVIRESLGEVEKCAWLCDYYADNAPKFLAREDVLTEAVKSYITFEPLGVVLAIMPWNFPFWQAFRFAIPAICAGN